MRITTASLLALLIGSVAACGGSSEISSSLASDAGASADAAPADARVAPTDGKADAPADAASDVDLASDAGGGASWGACSLAAAGHPTATPVNETLVDSEQLGVGTCASAVHLFGSAADYDAYRATHDAGASADGGLGVTIDWAHQSLVAVDAAGKAFTFGLEADTLVISAGYVCAGVAPLCTESLYVVPRVTGVVVAPCPAPSDPCLVP